MNGDGFHGTRPFGQRRAAPGLPEVTRPADDDRREPPRSGAVAWALRTAALSGFVALLATQYLVRVSGSGEAPALRVSVAARAVRDEPETTGSIDRPLPVAARGTRLDPCTLDSRPRP